MNSSIKNKNEIDNGNDSDSPLVEYEINEFGEEDEDDDIDVDDKSDSVLDQLLPYLQSILHKMNKIDNKLNNLENEIQDIREIISAKYPSKSSKKQLLKKNILHSEKTTNIIQKLNSKDIEIDSGSLDNIFPLKKFQDLVNLEAQLVNVKFAEAMAKYLNRFAPTVESIGVVFKFIGTDIFYHNFNLKGAAGKHALNKFKLFKKILYDACGSQIGVLQYEKAIKKCVLRSHNRYYKAKKNTPNPIDI